MTLDHGWVAIHDQRGSFGDVFTKVKRLTREQEHAGVKPGNGFEACIDVPGYTPDDPTTWLIDAVYSRGGSAEDVLYHEEPSFSTSIAIIYHQELL
jgi:hypothetical protein